MRAGSIKAEVEAVLEKLGLGARQYQWRGCEVSLVIAGEIETLRFPSGMSGRELAFVLGRLTGKLETLQVMGMGVGIAAVKANGHAEAHA